MKQHSHKPPHHSQKKQLPIPRYHPPSAAMSFTESHINKYGPWAVVTGASSGIGDQFARQLASSGLSIALVALPSDRNLRTIAAQLRKKYGVQTRTIPADISLPAGIDTVISKTAGLDVGLLVNNAGVEAHGSFFRHSRDVYQNLVAVNVAAVTALTHALGRRIANRSQGGAIVFVSSMASRGCPWLASYGASKAFVTAFALAIREELREKEVDVLVVEPGMVSPTGIIDEDRAKDVKEKTGATSLHPRVCVSQALEALVLGKARVTPGWRNTIMFWIMHLLPTEYFFRLAGDSMRESIDAHLLTYE